LTIIKKSFLLARLFGLSGLYMNLARYGQNPKRPALLLILVFILGSVYWSFFYSLGFDKSSSDFSIGPMNFSSTRDQPTNSTTVTKIHSFEINKVYAYNTWIPFERTLVNFVSLYEKPLFGDLLIRIITLPLLALLGISLRRKLERKELG
jgi:hypothetical protein